MSITRSPAAETVAAIGTMSTTVGVPDAPEELAGVLEGAGESVAALCRQRTGLIDAALRARVALGTGALRGPVAYVLDTGGKRFRPLLTLLACEAVGGSAEGALDLACALEFLHASSLLFDDLPCMDNADQRRGEPTLHRRDGEAVAVLTAIFFLNKAYELAIVGSGGDSWVPLAINRCIGQHGMVEGQLLDLAGRHTDRAVRRMKTGSLIRVCVELGARKGGASESRAPGAHRVFRASRAGVSDARRRARRRGRPVVSAGRERARRPSRGDRPPRPAAVAGGLGPGRAGLLRGRATGLIDRSSRRRQVRPHITPPPS